ncbi:hypothetical protein ACFX13_026181 [Malus domestica]
MSQYGYPMDIVALNSLLSAICRDGKAVDAVEFLRVAKVYIRPDPNTYAILFEGLENEGNDPNNVSAYDSFLNTLLKGPDGIREVVKFFETLKDRKCYLGINFFKLALDECVKKGDAKGADTFWRAMIGRIGFWPDTKLANCDTAVRVFLDSGDPYFAIKVWKCMMENYHSCLEDTRNLLVVGIRDLNRVPEAVKYVEDMIAKGIKLEFSTLSKLKHNLFQARKENVYDELLRKWKAQ